ncbi:hypothetical protein [Desulfocurvus sp. DL9XJH121]
MERISPLYFDKADHRLLAIVNEFMENDPSFKDFSSLLTPYLHPHGIKELASSTGLRIAYAVIRLLTSLEKGQAQERLQALAALRDEVLTTARGSMRTNTARALLQIMKELVRAKGRHMHQLKLAHDFRQVISGRPRIVRRELRKYYLVEMPEEWNQRAFDHRVHDANTKGRKSPTHLIMDAWIKGIRDLTVVYYNCVSPQTVKELLEAASIMGISVRFGLEFSATFRGRYVKLIWEPGGFTDIQGHLDFLESESAQEFLRLGAEAASYEQSYVFDALEAFNSVHAPIFAREFGVERPVISEADFRAALGSGQPSLHHLGAFIHARALPSLRRRFSELRRKSAAPKGGLTDEERAAAEAQSASIAALDPATIVERYLAPAANPDLNNPNVPSSQAPELMRLSPAGLAVTLKALHPGSGITLCTTGLRSSDVVEILYTCGGAITHLEILSLKRHLYEPHGDAAALNEIMQAVNDANVVILKRILRGCLAEVDEQQPPDEDARERGEALREVLGDIGGLVQRYKGTPLRPRFGTGSTGESSRSIGMGLVVLDTLSRGAVKALRRKQEYLEIEIPVTVLLEKQITHTPRDHGGRLWRLMNWLVSRVPGLENLTCRTTRSWQVRGFKVTADGAGNIGILGGVRDPDTSCFGQEGNGCSEDDPKVGPRYLNSHLVNWLKVLVGFIPAFLTFMLTKDWWVLAYLGGLIWFGITGLRNVIQAVLGGGGLRNLSLLRWYDYLNWGRISDSLLYTGFSVPLLDWLTKSLFLDQGLGINTSTAPVTLYTIMALVNGLYISSHNLFRGLPKSAAAWNFFRSILSIPLAVLFNAALGGILGMAGVAAVDSVLQKWAAVISKLASDCVAGIIEGAVDRGYNISMRMWDYTGKLRQVFEVFARLEVMFPDEDMRQVMAHPDYLSQITEGTGLDKVVTINALDLLCFWMYQPRAATALARALEDMSPEERCILLVSQRVLTQEREVSQLFVDGVVGARFARALSFYLTRYQDYLRNLYDMTRRMGLDDGEGLPAACRDPKAGKDRISR